MIKRIPIISLFPIIVRVLLFNKSSNSKQLPTMIYNTRLSIIFQYIIVCMGVVFNAFATGSYMLKEAIVFISL